MPLDASFITALHDKFTKPEVQVINGRPTLLMPTGWAKGELRFPEPHALTVATLSSVADYIKENVDELRRAQCILHVVDPVTVMLRGKLDDEAHDFRRPAYLTAKAVVPEIKLNAFLDAEVFYIQLQTLFEDEWDRSMLSRFVASMRESNVREVIDSGVSQEVKTAAGVTLAENSTVPNPVVLAPYRTFRDVDQPESKFVLRVRSKSDAERPTAALFDADGGLWRLHAIQNIEAYFRTHVDLQGDGRVPIIA